MRACAARISISLSHGWCTSARGKVAALLLLWWVGLRLLRPGEVRGTVHIGERRGRLLGWLLRWILYITSVRLARGVLVGRLWVSLVRRWLRLWALFRVRRVRRRRIRDRIGEVVGTSVSHRLRTRRVERQLTGRSRPTGVVVVGCGHVCGVVEEEVESEAEAK